MLTENRVVELLAPFGLELTPHQVRQLLTYTDLLLRWNRRINLTAVQTAEECVTRHFGESLYLARCVELQGKLLDVGSGAGFPGLALKLRFPQVSVTLLEPVAKKRAFLKEVARICGMESIQVRPERLEEFVRQKRIASFDAVSVRAVGHLHELVPRAAHCLKPGGYLCLWLSRDQAASVVGSQSFIDWGVPIALPHSRQRTIWLGTRT